MLQIAREEDIARLSVAPFGRGASVNLDELAREWADLRKIGPRQRNPLIEPAPCSGFVVWAAMRAGVDWTWGGYLEDRSFLWRGSYLDDYAGGAIHAGVDINVEAGTPVTAVAGTVLRVDDDTPELHGWGPRVFIEPAGEPGIVLIYAHLSAVQVHEGDELSAGTAIATVGAPPSNGNWYPHLHLQAVRRDFFDAQLPGKLKGLDGYFPGAERERWVEIYPDPFPIVQRLRAR